MAVDSTRAIPVAAASVAVGAVAFVLLEAGPVGSEDCEAARDVMERLWWRDRRGAVRPELTDPLLGQLDRFAERWTWHAVDRCHAKEAAAAARGSWVRRDLCGQRQAEIFDAVVWALYSGVGVPERVVEQLPSIADCENSAYYRAEPPLPANPNRQATAMALRLDLARAGVFLGAGELAAAEDALDDLEPRVSELGYAALQVESDYLRLLLAQDVAPDAASALVAAAEAGGHDRIAARAWILYSQSLRDASTDESDRTRAIATARAERTMDPVALRWLECLDAGGDIAHGRCSDPP